MKLHFAFDKHGSDGKCPRLDEIRSKTVNLGRAREMITFGGLSFVMLFPRGSAYFSLVSAMIFALFVVILGVRDFFQVLQD